MPPLNSLADHSGATADAALVHRPGVRAVERGEDVSGFDVEAVDVVEPAIPGLGDHRERPRILDDLRRLMLDSRQAMTASRTMPTLWVLVIMTGPSRSRIPRSRWCRSSRRCRSARTMRRRRDRTVPAARGMTAVTPVRTGPLPTTSLPSPEMSVVWPTVTPATSVIAFHFPGVPSKGTPRSRAPGFGGLRAGRRRYEKQQSDEIWTFMARRL